MKSLLPLWCFVLLSTAVYSQDNRTQYPSFLSRAYFGVEIGYINYPFSNAPLKPGYTSSSVSIPHAAVRVTLLGYRFNKNLSAELNYMRPVLWVRYEDLNGDPWNLPVYMNVATVVLNPSVPLNKRLWLDGEIGLAIVTRNGFEIDQTKIMEDANYASASLGAGLSYHLNRKWNFRLHGSYSPANKNYDQPYTSFFSAGFRYNIVPLPDEVVKRNAEGGYSFPRNLLQVGYVTNQFGYGTNDFVSKGPVPVFWGGHAQVKSGFTLHYQRNIFHTRKVFSLDWGGSFSYYKSNELKDRILALSLFPLFRFTLLRFKPLDIYMDYSLAGPSYISRTTIDSLETGKNFTFQDFMGMGMYAGKKRRINFEMRITHYSNGNLFPNNDGVKVPLSFNAGWTF